MTKQQQEQLRIALVRESPDEFCRLRDQFAAAALTGMLAADPDVTSLLSLEALSDCSYNLADAMLARRSAQPTTGAPAPQPGAVDAAPTKGT